MVENVQNDTSRIINKLLNYYMAQKNFEQDVGDYLRSKVKYPKVYSNDLRHQYASAVTAQQLGDKSALFLGNLHEWLYPGGHQDTAIDKYNNRMGREYAKKYPKYTKQQYLDVLFKDADLIKQQRKKELGF